MSKWKFKSFFFISLYFNPKDFRRQDLKLRILFKHMCNLRPIFFFLIGEYNY